MRLNERTHVYWAYCVQGTQYPMPVHVITLNLLMTISLDPCIPLSTGYLSSTTNLKLNL